MVTSFVKRILQSLAFFLPIGVTIWVMVWLFGYLREVLKAVDILSLWLKPSKPETELLLSLGSFVLLVFMVLVVGMIAQGFFGRWLHKTLDKVMDLFPGVNVFYRAIKQLLSFLFRERDEMQKGTGEVVLVRAFHDQAYSLGFVMGRSRSLDPSGKVWLKVFVPGVPNISSGFLILVEEKDVTKLSTTVDQASAFLVSLGIIKDIRRKL
ncbi:DUF502 domain-containing protein [Thermospira aquatica]|nr:DUF502 domain-containing protein [Thermospira aquatica]